MDGSGDRYAGSGNSKTTFMNPLTTLLLLGFLLLLLVAPFAALAPLVLLAVVGIAGMMVWTLIRTVLTGQPNDHVASRDES